MTPIEATKELYDHEIRPLLVDRKVSDGIKKALACKYVYLMADTKAGRNHDHELRTGYQNLKALIEKARNGGTYELRKTNSERNS